MCKVQTRSSFLTNIKTPFFGNIKLKAIFHSLHHLSYEMTIGARSYIAPCTENCSQNFCNKFILNNLEMVYFVCTFEPE